MGHLLGEKGEVSAFMVVRGAVGGGGVRVLACDHNSSALSAFQPSGLKKRCERGVRQICGDGNEVVGPGIVWVRADEPRNARHPGEVAASGGGGVARWGVGAESDDCGAREWVNGQMDRIVIQHTLVPPCQRHRGE